MFQLLSSVECLSAGERCPPAVPYRPRQAGAGATGWQPALVGQTDVTSTLGGEANLSRSSAATICSEESLGGTLEDQWANLCCLDRHGVAHRSILEVQLQCPPGGLQAPRPRYRRSSTHRRWVVRYDSVDRTWLCDPHAFDPEHSAKRIEVVVVVQHACAAPSRGGGDQVVGRRQAPLASQVT